MSSSAQRILITLSCASALVAAAGAVRASETGPGNDAPPFTSATWLAAVFECGPRSAVSRPWLDRIFRTSGGRYYVPSAAEREAVEALRKGPDARREIAACLAEAEMGTPHVTPLETYVRGTLVEAAGEPVAVWPRSEPQGLMRLGRPLADFKPVDRGTPAEAVAELAGPWITRVVTAGR